MIDRTPIATQGHLSLMLRGQAINFISYEVIPPSTAQRADKVYAVTRRVTRQGEGTRCAISFRVHWLLAYVSSTKTLFFTNVIDTRISLLFLSKVGLLHFLHEGVVQVYVYCPGQQH